MILKKDEDHVPMPAYCQIWHVCVMRPDHMINLFIHELPAQALFDMRDSYKEVRGVPVYFAALEGRLEFYPKADMDYDVHVRYTTLHEL